MVAAGVSAVAAIDGMGAAEDAANAQSNSAAVANGMTREAAARQRNDLMPWMQGGAGAQNALLDGLGTLGNGANRSKDEIRMELVQGYGMQSGDPALEQRVNDAYQAQYKGGSGSLLKQFDQADLDKDLVFQNTYKTALDTGLNALNSRAANSGNWGSGAALKALTRFGANTANQFTGDAYNRNMGEKNQKYSFLSGQSQMGQNAAAGVGVNGMNAANIMGQNTIGAGNAQASGIIGGANALSGGIADATNAFQWNQLLNKPKSSSGLSNSWDIPMQPGGGY